MSLFGDEDVPSRAKQSSSLFDDDPKPAGKPGNSLFADEIDSNDSPWALPTPKKAGRASLVKSLLPASDVPDSYIDAFDAVLDAGDRAGSGISIEGAKKLLASSGLPNDAQARMLEIVQSGQDESAGLGRNEFNVLYALIGLAQEGEDVTLDSVDERKRSQCIACMLIRTGVMLTAYQIYLFPQYRCPSRRSSNQSHPHPHRNHHAPHLSSSLPSNSCLPRAGRAHPCASSLSETQKRIPGAAQICTRDTTTRPMQVHRLRRTVRTLLPPRAPRASSPHTRLPIRHWFTTMYSRAHWVAKAAGEATTVLPTSLLRHLTWATAALARPLLAAAPIHHLSWGGQLVAWLQEAVGVRRSSPSLPSRRRKVSSCSSIAIMRWPAQNGLPRLYAATVTLSGC
jgi:hypothetical protein